MSETEIERRYLLRGMPYDIAQRAYEIIKIKNGYLPGDIIQERFSRRTKVDADGNPVKKTVYKRSVKVGHGLTRFEFKEKINVDFFIQMWVHTFGARVKKRRHRVLDKQEHGDFVWEVDKFSFRDLYLAEVELPTEETEVVIPSWLEKFVIREVTEEPEYEGINLAH